MITLYVCTMLCLRLAGKYHCVRLIVQLCLILASVLCLYFIWCCLIVLRSISTLLCLCQSTKSYCVFLFERLNLVFLLHVLCFLVWTLGIYFYIFVYGYTLSGTTIIINEWAVLSMPTIHTSLCFCSKHFKVITKPEKLAEDESTDLYRTPPNTSSSRECSHFAWKISLHCNAVAYNYSLINVMKHHLTLPVFWWALFNSAK